MASDIRDLTLFKSACYVDGKWISAVSGKTIIVTNPFNGDKVGLVPDLQAEDIIHAIESAQGAFPGWRELLAAERSSLLKRWHTLVLDNADDLARIMVLEQGKPLREAAGEIRYAASYIEFYAEEAIRIYGDLLPSPFRNTKILIFKQPVGVVGIITPWNFPAAMMTRKIAPALAAGCTCVVKPDETTPLTALAFAELASRAGFPKGVLNIVTGNPVLIGDLLTSHEKVRKISFTGSTDVGKLLMRKSADTVKKITLELGGNAPFIVFEDASVEEAVAGLVESKFRNAGQTCVCANRVFLHKRIAEKFIARLVEKVKDFTIGNGMEDNDIGPLINLEAVEKIERLIADAVAKGAILRTGGKRHPRGGTFFEPAVLTNVTNTMQIYCTEIFGPVVTVTEFEDTREVLRMANDTRSGLAAYFFTQNLERLWHVAENLEYGMVGINSGSISSAAIPFGGVKESGFGREGSHYGIDDYITVKYVHLKCPAHFSQD